MLRQRKGDSKRNNPKQMLGSGFFKNRPGGMHENNSAESGYRFDSLIFDKDVWVVHEDFDNKLGDDCDDDDLS
eukprot:jgi/Bigna1/141347/aug1.62_g16055